jgi:DNA-binding CsgD family transcriptional regulator
VVRLSRRDLEGALGFVHAASSAQATEPFPRPVVESLARLVPGVAVGYAEWSLETHVALGVAVETPAIPMPRDISEARAALCSTYPLSMMSLREARQACRLSDFASRSALHRLEYYDCVLRPFGIEHQMRLFLPAPRGFARFFSFSRQVLDGDFSDRERAVLDLLRPFLIAMRERFELRASPTPIGIDSLTAREEEILQWVALGKTNDQIATSLVVSTHTVRKHLENIYAKLGVHTRTAAVAHVQRTVATNVPPPDSSPYAVVPA